MKQPVYLDYAATTPVDPRVAEKMMAYLTLEGEFGNPASQTHGYGWAAQEAVAQARRDVADLINAKAREIVWTSGATESDNLAIKGVANFYKNKGRHIVTVKTEHKAVLDTCAYLEQCAGFEVTYLLPRADGRLDLASVEAAIRSDTILLSVMHVNNETGVLQDMTTLGALAATKELFFHVDAAQGLGKCPIDVNAWQVDLLSASGHKVYGPKGVGILYVREQPKVRLEPMMHGGGHERGLRSGTLPTHQIVGMGEACRIAKQAMAQESTHVRALRDRLWQGIQTLEGVSLNGHADETVAGILNVSFDAVDGEALLMALDALAVSTGSACNSASIEPSHVLTALGVSDELAHSALRFSLGRFSTAEEIDFTIEQVITQVNRLRAMSPLWSGAVRDNKMETK